VCQPINTRSACYAARSWPGGSRGPALSPLRIVDQHCRWPSAHAGQDPTGHLALSRRPCGCHHHDAHLPRRRTNARQRHDQCRGVLHLARVDRDGAAAVTALPQQLTVLVGVQDASHMVSAYRPGTVSSTRYAATGRSIADQQDARVRRWPAVQAASSPSTARVSPRPGWGDTETHTARLQTSSANHGTGSAFARLPMQHLVREL
jgi:hypothetical protein